METSIIPKLTKHQQNLRAMKDALRDIRHDKDLGPTLTPEVWARLQASLIEHAHGTAEDWPSDYE